MEELVCKLVCALNILSQLTKCKDSLRFIASADDTNESGTNKRKLFDAEGNVVGKGESVGLRVGDFKYCSYLMSWQQEFQLEYSFREFWVNTLSVQSNVW